MKKFPTYYFDWIGRNGYHWKFNVCRAESPFRSSLTGHSPPFSTPEHVFQPQILRHAPVSNHRHHSFKVVCCQLLDVKAPTTPFIWGKVKLFRAHTCLHGMLRHGEDFYITIEIQTTSRWLSALNHRREPKSSRLHLFNKKLNFISWLVYMNLGFL